MNTTTEFRASIFTPEQETELRRLKSYFPFRIVWGAVNVNTEPHTFECGASHTRRELNKRMRSGWLVATIE